jgi:hypothetical protein
MTLIVISNLCTVPREDGTGKSTCFIKAVCAADGRCPVAVSVERGATRSRDSAYISGGRYCENPSTECFEDFVGRSWGLRTTFAIRWIVRRGELGSGTVYTKLCLVEKTRLMRSDPGETVRTRSEFRAVALETGKPIRPRTQPRPTLSALKNLIDSFNSQKDGMDGHPFSPTFFPFPPSLRLFFPLFFSLSFRPSGQSFLFFFVRLYVFGR